MKDKIPATANAIRPILRMIDKDQFALTLREKLLLEQQGRAVRYVPPYTQLLWGIDDWLLDEYSLKWEASHTTRSPCHLITVASEGHPQIFSVVLTQSQPRAYDYALALRLAITREQQLSNLPASRPIVLVADNCGATIDPEFEMFCAAAGVKFRPAKPKRPWAKPGVERAVHTLQARVSLSSEQIRLNYRDDVSAPPLIECNARDFLNSAIQGARRFHEAAVKGETFHTRY
ncbi:MAG: hypothetical protein ACOYMS_11240, partial [Terrimicrobiaceae bacterium]